MYRKSKRRDRKNGRKQDVSYNCGHMSLHCLRNKRNKKKRKEKEKLNQEK